MSAPDWSAEDLAEFARLRQAAEAAENASMVRAIDDIQAGTARQLTREEIASFRRT